MNVLRVVGVVVGVWFGVVAQGCCSCAHRHAAETTVASTTAGTSSSS